MATQKIEYRTEKIDERRKSEVRICSSDMTEKQAEDIINSLGKSGFDVGLEPEKDKVCVVVRLLEVFKKK